MSSAFDRLAKALGHRYAVERELGRGGMATVYLAQDLKHHRRVALKVLHPDLAASMGSERFLHEISVTAGLSHPHILPLYDSGAGEGLLYYVMPYVEGESLRDRLDREHMLPVNDAIQIAREIAEALDYAHEHGVVHRDIKPANIQLVGAHPVVADFGISRAVAAAGGTKLTQTGMVVGTPAYMSPEQASGSEEVDGRTDIYSLGCVLYEMLVGETPFHGTTPQALLARHTLEQVPSPRIVRPSVPALLEEIVFRALAKLPVDRFRTAGELAEALKSLTTGTHPTHVGLDPSWRRAKPKRRRAWLVAAAVIVVSGALVVGNAWLGGADGGSRADAGLDLNRIAVLYFQDQSADGSLGPLTTGLTESLIDRLSLVRGLDVVSSNGSARYASTELPRDSIARALEAGTLVEGSVEEVGDRLRLTVRLVDGLSGAEYDRLAVERPATDLIVLRDTLATEVSRLLRESLGQEIQLQELQSAASNSEAWSLVLTGRREWRAVWSLLQADSLDAAIARLEQADSLLARAETLDPAWPAPSVARAYGTYWRSQWRGTSDRPYADRWSRVALDHAERALARAPDDPLALKTRGEIRYWRWLMGTEVDADDAARLFADAEADLRGAVAADRGRADAWELLSHLLTNKPGGQMEARLAAQRAYEADAYLDNVDRVVERLYFASYDMEDYVEAVHWCRLGAQRFPGVERFKECQIWIMTMVGGEPDPDAAWRLVEEYVELNEPGYRPYRRLKARMAVAAVLARAGLPDSARAVVRSSLGDRTVDPSRDTYLNGAFALVLVGDHAEAVRLLSEWAAANPARAYTLIEEDSWWWRDLQGRSDFQALATLASPSQR